MRDGGGVHRGPLVELHKRIIEVGADRAHYDLGVELLCQPCHAYQTKAQAGGRLYGERMHMGSQEPVEADLSREEMLRNTVPMAPSR